MRGIERSRGVAVSWLPTVAGVLLVAGGLAAPAEAQSGRSGERRAEVTRSERARQMPASGQRGTVRRGATADRSRGRHRGSHYRRYRGSRVHLGLSYGWPFYYYGSYYYGPYYWGPYRHSPFDYGYRYRYAYPEALGAFDLNVKPKKTEVYLDGRLIGPAGKFDGYPGKLWLPKGEHQLVFYRPGFVTEVRVVESLPGVEVNLAIDMRPGESTPVEQVAVAPEPAPAPVRRAPGERAARWAPADRQAPTERGGETLDIREEPGRLVLRVAPDDAAVYLDGRFLGTAGELSGLHAGLLIDAGEHVLEVLRPGSEHALRFSVEPGEEQELAVDLNES